MPNCRLCGKTITQEQSEQNHYLCSECDQLGNKKKKEEETQTWKNRLLKIIGFFLVLLGSVMAIVGLWLMSVDELLINWGQLLAYLGPLLFLSGGFSIIGFKKLTTPKHLYWAFGGILIITILLTLASTFPFLYRGNSSILQIINWSETSVTTNQAGEHRGQQSILSHFTHRELDFRGFHRLQLFSEQSAEFLASVNITLFPERLDYRYVFKFYWANDSLSQTEWFGGVPVDPPTFYGYYRFADANYTGFVIELYQT